MNSKKITGIILLVALLVMVSIAPVYAKTYDVTFDSDYYANRYADLKRAFGNDEAALRRHFMTYGIKEGRQASVAFDVKYYLGKYPDLQRAFGKDNYQAAYNHFVTYGINEGRNASAEFDAKHYLGNYPDLQRAFGNKNYAAAYNHYLAYGINEGRTAVTENSHVYGETKVTKEATCTEAGEQVSTCTVCKAEKIEEIPALGHTYGEAEVTKPETCTEDGEKTSTCTVCGDVKTEVIPAAHSYTEKRQLTDPTCTEDGSYIMICDRDGCAAVEQEVNEEGNTVNKIYVDGKLGHSFTEKRVLEEPTCTKDGSYVMACEREACGEIEKELNEEGMLVNQVYTEPKLGHTFVKDAEGNDKVWTKAATCEKDGYELKVCSVCGETVSTVLPKLGHNYGTPVFTWNELTATAKVICENNEAHTIPVDVNVTPETTPATCEEDGKTVYTATATYNDETYTDTKTVAIPASGHDWNAGVTTALPNGDDLTTYTCNTCEATRTETTHNHLVTYKTLKEATCGENGLDAQICLNCNQTVETVTIKEHDAVLTKTDRKEATCTEAGNIDYWTCESCGKHFDAAESGSEITLEETVIPATGHTLNKTEAQAKTCTLPGNTEYWTCSECHKYFSDEGTTEIDLADTVVPAAHTLTKTEAQAKTCTLPGNTEYWTCSECHKYFSDEGTTEINLEDTVVPAAHTLTKTEAKAATCTEDGNADYWTCSVCDKIFSNAEGTTETTLEAVKIAATGHDLVKTNAQAATCEVAGNTDYWTCNTCNKIYSDAEGTTEIDLADTVVPAAHDLTKHNAKAATCTVEGNEEYYTCANCSTIFKDADGSETFENLAATVIPAGHAWSVVGTKAACEYATLTCLNEDCEYYGKEVSAKTLIDDAVITEEAAEAAGYVPTMAHDIDTIIIVEPTAEKDGLATDHCNICHKDIRVKYTLTYVAP